MSTTPKLYRVTISEIHPGGKLVERTQFWVAAKSRREAEKRAMHGRIWIAQEHMHVRVECFTGGSAHIGYARLEKPA